jgi:hypothetical protein
MSTGFCTLHEYRTTYALIGFTGFVTGLIDALIDDFTVKAFLWAFTLWLALIASAYELTIMPVPPKPFTQSILLITLGTAGLLSIHHFTWLAVSILIGRSFSNVLWLAPNMYVDFRLYTTVSAYMFIVYMAYLIYINIKSCD